MGKPSEQGLFLDNFGALSGGMNSDVPAIDLPKNQAAFLTNATCRGNYFTHRPPYRDFTLTFNGEIQSAFEDGLFQGCCFYKPDVGRECLIASISGRLYQITPDLLSATASVSDITPASGASSATAPFAWMWQSEKWVIRNDGEAQPMFFDGNSTRYSDPGTVVGTMTAPLQTIPAIGSSVLVTLSAPFTGVYGTTLKLINGTTVLGNFQVSQFTSGSSIRLLNVSGTVGANIPTGELVQSIGNYSGVASSGVVIPNGGSGSLSLSPNFTGAVGSVLKWGNSASNFYFRVDAITPTGVTLTDLTLNGTSKTILVGNQFQIFPANPNTTVVTTTAGFTIPAVGATVDVTSDSPFSGADGTYVDVGGYSFRAYVVPPPSGQVQVYLTNINSSATGTFASGTTLNTLAELPPGRMGDYGLGRNWQSLVNGTSYIGSDIVGSSSGTVINQFRDAVLNVTENNYLAGGGVFWVPSAGQQINAMRFPATLDSSLGQGPLQVFTWSTTFSCNAPVQRSTWQDLTNPIQTQSLVGGGAVSQFSAVAVNGDIWFRSLDGIRSLKLARQDFQTSFGNTPQSVEMNRVLMEDNQNLLTYCGGVNFDNRLLMTATPQQADNGNVYHETLIALNLDPNSSLRQKYPPIYDGAWKDRNILRPVTGTFGGVERAFAFIFDVENQTIGLTEILKTREDNEFDNGTDRIQFSMESPAMFYQPETATRQLLRLNDGELIIKDLSGTVRFDVFYRPDYDTAWHSWHSWEVSDTPSWNPRMGLGQPDLKQGDSDTGRPFAVGYHFQLLIVVTGSCTILGCNVFAVGQSDTKFMKPLTRLTPIDPSTI